MASFEEIKGLFTNELKNTPQYQTTLAIKALILNEIATPNIKQYINYTFEQPLTPDEIQVLQMCIQIEFGFLETNISEYNIGINMANFLK